MNDSIERETPMGQVLVRGLDAAIIARLKRRAAAGEVSLEEMLRRVLTEAAGPSRADIADEIDRIRAMTPRRMRASSTGMVRRDRDRE
jgi:antitoxin FitA